MPPVGEKQGTVPKQMALGDHIKTKRAGGLYTHHGIDMGDGTVIHFSGEPSNFRAAVVCRITLEEFLQGGEALVVEHDAPVLSPEETARLAESLIGARGYHPLRNNCEHFTTYCKTGRKNSPQARRFIRAAVAAGFTALAVGAHVAGQLRKRGRERQARTVQQPKERRRKT